MYPIGHAVHIPYDAPIKKEGFYSYHGMAGPSCSLSKQLGQGNGIAVCSSTGGGTACLPEGGEVELTKLDEQKHYGRGDTLLSFDANQRQLKCSINGTPVYLFSGVPRGWRFAISGSGGEGIVEATYAHSDSKDAEIRSSLNSFVDCVVKLPYCIIASTLEPQRYAMSFRSGRVVNVAGLSNCNDSFNGGASRRRLASLVL